VLEHAESATARARAAWESLDAGAPLTGDDGLERASRDLRRRAEAEVRAWQAEILELVRTEGADKRASARFMAYGMHGLAAALSVVVLDRNGTADASALGRTLLEAVFGAPGLEVLIERAGPGLERRVAGLLETERRRYLDLLAGLDIPANAPEQLRAASRRVDDRRFEQARSEAGPEV
jgi:hypothetical protein